MCSVLIVSPSLRMMTHQVKLWPPPPLAATPFYILNIRGKPFCDTLKQMMWLYRPSHAKDAITNEESLNSEPRGEEVKAEKGSSAKKRFLQMLYRFSYNVVRNSPI